MSEHLKAAFDLLNVGLVLTVNAHLIFHRLIRVNNRAVITAPEVQTNGFE